jgi:hypothetical protein
MLRFRSTRFPRKRGRYFVPALHGVLGWLLMIVWVFVTVSCHGNSAADDPLADHSFLTQQPCAVPCWYGLEPDKSSESEVYAALNKLPFVDPATIVEFGTTWLDGDEAKQIGFGCLHPKDPECGGSLVLSQGKLKRISLRPPYQLTFQMAADRLGPPDYLDYKPFSAHGDGCVITLDWRQKGVSVTHIDRTNGNRCEQIHKNGRVPSDIPVTQMIYVAPETFQPWPKGIVTSSTPFPGFAKP